MTLRINHNIAAINSHRNLLANDHNMSKTLESLSSGYKINRGADGPASLVISEQMRAQIGGMEQAIDNSETAISMVQTTEANLGEVSNLLTAARQLAIHAANEGVNDELMMQADQKELDNAMQTIRRIALQAQFGNKRLLDGSNGATGTTTGADLEFVDATLNTQDSSTNGFEVRVNQSASRANATGFVAFDQNVVSGGETLTVIENGKRASYTTTGEDSVNTAIQNLGVEIRKNGLGVDVQLSDNGMLQVKHQKYGSEYGFQVSSSTEGVLSGEAAEIEVARAGLDIRGTINGETATGRGQVLTGIRGAENVEGVAIRFSGELLSETQTIEQALEEGIAVENASDIDASGEATAEENDVGEVVGRVFVSQNSLKFQVGANIGQTVGISMDGIQPNLLGRGIENESGFRSLADVNVVDFQTSQDALLLIDQAVNEIAARRGDLGAFQKNTLESNLNNLRIANENLIQSESVIRDTDMAEQMATFTKNQIMSQAATAMLAQANQTPKNVLQLLG